MAAGDLEAPTIPLLINNYIDPDALNGEALPTYAKYVNPLLGDKLIQNWLGKTETGKPVDVTDVEIDVDPDRETEYGFLMPIANHFVKELDKGQVFYSYFLKRALPGSIKEESNRIHFGIGKEGLLSAPQIKESHDLQLDVDAVTGSLTIALTPYAQMSAGDRVKLIWKGEKSNGDPGREVDLPVKTLSDTDTDPTNNPGQVLSWSVEKVHFVPLKEGKLTLSYEITYASSLTVTLSAERMILISPPNPASPVLPVASVKGLTGTEINPGLFPDGIRIEIPVYRNIRVGDEVVVYGTRTGSGIGVAKNTIAYLKIDKSNIDTRKIEVPIGVKWLIDNRGGDVSVDYQYARPDAAGSGATLNLTVREQLVLPPPTVDNSVVSDKRDELDPAVAIGGAYITIPANDAIGNLEVTAYWKGFGESGSCETNVPSQTEPMIKFRVPPEYLPPNFGKTVEVTYQVDGQEADSSLLLYIRQLGDPPGIACNLVGVGSPATLKLSAFTDEGGVLSMRRWPFISTQQQVRFWLSSLEIGDRELMAARNILPEEVSAGVKVSLFKEHLAGITINNQVTFKASVSFDGGNSTVAFGVPLAVKLLD